MSQRFGTTTVARQLPPNAPDPTELGPVDLECQWILRLPEEPAQVIVASLPSQSIKQSSEDV